MNMLELLATGLLVALSGGCTAAKPGIKVSERWGYDPVDATKCLQAAFDSGAPHIIIDRQAGPWYALPLKGRSNQIIEFEDGAELRAKRGAYQDLGSTLLTFAERTNVVIRGKGVIGMWREDYDKAPYAHSEWRHGISLRGCRNVTIEDMRICETGGDGVYLGVNGDTAVHSDGNFAPNRNVTIRNCVFDRNYRQGISVISAADLLVERCAFTDTHGSPPEDGIDFEPNHPRQLCENCIIRDCTFSGNAGRAVEVVLLQFDSTSKPVSIRIEGCRSTGDIGGFNYLGAKKDITIPVDDGRVDIENCVFEKEKTYAANIVKKVFSSGTVAFKDCLFDGCCVKDPSKPDVDILVTGHEIYPADTVSFDNVTIRQGVRREWLSAPRLKSYRGTPTRITGSVKVVAPDGAETTTVMDEAWNAARYPSVPGAPVETLKAVAVSGANLTAVDARPGEMAAMSPLCVRGRNRYAALVSAPGKLRLVGHERLIGARKPSDVTISLRRYGTTAVLDSRRLKACARATDVEFDIGEPGLYTLVVLAADGNAFAIDSANVPLALDVSTSPVSLVYPEGDLYVWQPSGKRFCLFGSGDGMENFAAEVFDPSDVSVRRQDNSLESFHYTSPNSLPEGLWRIRLSKPALGVLEDCVFKVTGVPGFLFLSREKYWK